MSVGKICIREVDLVDPDENVSQAAKRMHQRAVGSLVVVDQSTRPIGIVTDRDIVERVVAQDRDPHSTEVHEVMTAVLSTIGEDEPIESALSLMRRGRNRRLVVVDGTDKLVGILSLDDVLMLLSEEFGQIGGLLEGESARGVAARVFR